MRFKDYQAVAKRHTGLTAPAPNSQIVVYRTRHVDETTGEEFISHIHHRVPVAHLIWDNSPRIGHIYDYAVVVGR